MNSADRAIYLDNAATSFPKPDAVYDAVNRYLRANGAAAGRGAHASVDAAGRMIAQCRERVARLIGAESPDRIAFTFNCTDSLNLILRGVLCEGDHVLTSRLEHNSVLRPLSDLSDERGVSVHYLDFDPDTGQVAVDDLERHLNSVRTKLVVLSHASNVLGTVQPVAQLVQAAHRHGALFLLDAAQTAGHLPLSCAQLSVDFAAAAGHKGMLGPLGTGIVYVRAEQELQLRHVRSGGTGTVSESLRQPADMPFRLESGNMNAPGLAGLSEGVQWLLEAGVDQVHQQISQQTARLSEALDQMTNVATFGQHADSENVGIISFLIAGCAPSDAAAILDQSFGIQCRAGLHCAPLCHQHLKTDQGGGTIRLSPGPFTTDSEITAAIRAIEEIAASF